MPRTRGNHDDEAGSSRPKRTREFETVKEAMLPRGCGEEIEEMFEIKLVEMGGDQEIFSSKAWRRAFDINEQIYVELCYKVYSTYEFNELVQDDELWSSKIIKFRLGGRDHPLTLLQFAKRLGLYFNKEIGEEGFETYFCGGLHSDEHFNAREYWLSISREEDLHLSRSHASTIRKPILRVLQKMISYGLCQRMNRHDKVQKNDLWLLIMFEANQDGYANVTWVITKWMKKKGAGKEVLIGLSAPTHCRALDRITLRELIGPNGKLITKAPMPGATRVAMPVPLHPSMHDLYDRMGNIEIR
ncbi:hypothetical protein Tco_0291860 [Tanacetum coccineum]